MRLASELEEVASNQVARRSWLGCESRFQQQQRTAVDAGMDDDSREHTFGHKAEIRAIVKNLHDEYIEVVQADGTTKPVSKDTSEANNFYDNACWVYVDDVSGNHLDWIGVEEGAENGISHHRRDVVWEVVDHL